MHEALVGGFAAMRALSQRNDDPAGASPAVRQGSRRVRHRRRSGHARPRGPRARAAPAARRILAELLGYGATADAFHITLPPPGGIGAVRAARRAIDEGRPDPADIDHVNAHATSTPEGDKAELQAIRDILGEQHAGEVPITASKSMLGHTLGAAGAIEAAITILALRDGCVPPTINLHRSR